MNKYQQEQWDGIFLLTELKPFLGTPISKSILWLPVHVFTYYKEALPRAARKWADLEAHVHIPPVHRLNETGHAAHLSVCFKFSVDPLPELEVRVI